MLVQQNVRLNKKVGRLEEVLNEVKQNCENFGDNSSATSAHIRPVLWLLPSGPDQVRKVVLREDQGVISEASYYAVYYRDLQNCFRY